MGRKHFLKGGKQSNKQGQRDFCLLGAYSVVSKTNIEQVIINVLIIKELKWLLDLINKLPVLLKLCIKFV